MFYTELHDAIEGYQLAGHTRSALDETGRGIFCVTPDPSNERTTISVDCGAAEKFIAERLRN
jgi:hypothetical protein